MEVYPHLLRSTVLMQPLDKARLKRLGLEQGQHAAKDVLARDAVRQVQDPQQKFFLDLGPARKAGSTTVDLEYDPTTFVGKFSPKAFRTYEKRFEELKGVKFDPSYVRHLSRHYGGIPKKQCFKTRKGTALRLGRFLNYLNRESVEPPIRKSWQGHGHDIQLDWSVDYIIDPLDYFPSHFHPFASLYMGPHHPDEMVEFDLLCFDYSEAGRPKIVVWYNDESKFSDEPVMEKVAENFDVFLAMLKEHKEPRKAKTTEVQKQRKS